MKNKKYIKMNRTGIDASPINSKEMIEGSITFKHLVSPGSDREMAENRIRFIKEAEPLGSVPIPATVKGVAKAGLQLITGHDPKLLIDKLGERLAFERTGVRLYDALLSKLEGNSSEDVGGASVERLKEIRNQELKHFITIAETMKAIGADPTAITPDGDIVAVTAMGIQKVLTDSRTTFGECLEAILIAELVDNDAWRMLVKLSEEAGLIDAAEKFRAALREEEDHLSTVRLWLEELNVSQLSLRKKIA